MTYKIGNSKLVNAISETTKLQCPNCKNEVEFSVFSNYKFGIKPSFPFVNNKNVYFLVCPKCAGIFTVEQNKGLNFSKGEKLAIGDYDLKKLKKFN